MKIDIITCHNVYNFGASLQAYALSHYLITIDHDVRIIDYKPLYRQGFYSLTAINNPKYDRPIIRQLYILAKLWGRIKTLKQKNLFDKFTKNYLPLTDRYNSYDELSENPPLADLYITGSDQIWNTFFQTGRDEAFYLSFVKSNAKKISYAASFTVENIQPEFRDFVKTHLQGLNSISVREKSALKILSSFGIQSGVHVCDPVFLLPRNHWNNLSSLSTLMVKEHILVYECSFNPLIRRTAETLRQITGYKIAFLGKWDAADVSIPYSDPIDFLYCVNNAKYVITDSFHATAFSIIFEKPFFVAERTEPLNSRIHDLLHLTDLDDRLISNSHPIDLSPIKFSAHTVKLKELILSSKEFLNNEISTNYTAKR